MLGIRGSVALGITDEYTTARRKNCVWRVSDRLDYDFTPNPLCIADQPHGRQCGLGHSTRRLSPTMYLPEARAPLPHCARATERQSVCARCRVAVHDAYEE